MDLDYYIETVYGNDSMWFKEEVNRPHNRNRVAKDYQLMNYLNGTHEVLNREDMEFKGNKFVVKKLILNIAKTILNFHSTYLLGNRVSLTGSERLVGLLKEVYKYGNFNNTDLDLLQQVNRYGGAFEYIYRDNNGNITSKVIKDVYSYPVYADDGSYIAFIEYWTNLEHVSYWNVYTNDSVVEWTNEGGTDHILNEYNNESGLPIRYMEGTDYDYRVGEGLLSNIIPILDEIEDLMSKMGDAIYTLSLSPIAVTTGQQIDGNITNNDYVGYTVNFETGGNLDYANAEMDYNTIKMYLDKLENYLNMVSYLPSILGGNGNIANVSEVSLKMLYSLADVWAMLSEKIMRTGFNERINVIRKLLGENNDNEYVELTFNYARPQNMSELLDNIKKQYDMMAISIQTIIEKSPITNDDVVMELNRLKDSKSDVEENDNKTGDIKKTEG